MKKEINSYSNEHPIVRTHPETGKKILYVNWTYTKQIIGMDKQESDRILKEIFEHQARLDLTCRFNWTEKLLLFGIIEVLFIMQLQIFFLAVV